MNTKILSQKPLNTGKNNFARARKVLEKLGYTFVWDKYNRGPRYQLGLVSPSILEAITLRVQANGFKSATPAAVMKAATAMARDAWVRGRVVKHDRDA